MEIRGHSPARMRPPLSRLSEAHAAELRELLADLESEAVEQ
jgi:4-hydroxy-tetrahydrodipicolinate synthase